MTYIPAVAPAMLLKKFLRPLIVMCALLENLTIGFLINRVKFSRHAERGKKILPLARRSRMLGGLRRSLASQYDEPTLYLASSEFNRQTSLSRWSHLPHLPARLTRQREPAWAVWRYCLLSIDSAVGRAYGEHGLTASRVRPSADDCAARFPGASDHSIRESRR